MLDEVDASGAAATICVSRETLIGGDYQHLMPDCETLRTTALAGLAYASGSDTGVSLLISSESSVAIQPPVPITLDFLTDGAYTQPLRDLLSSEPTVAVVLLRLGRYAVGVLRGARLLATKTDSRYMKNRHRAGGQSQRRFQRSRERLIRELYDKTCEVTRTIFGPHMRDIDHVMLGGERNILNGFLKRCRLMQELQPRTLTRRLAVDSPNQRALQGISREVWKSRVTFYQAV